MEAVTTEGTAKDVLKIFPFQWPVKRALHTLPAATYKYYDGVYQASFVGYFPADQPEYTCIVVVKTNLMPPFTMEDNCLHRCSGKLLPNFIHNM
jgi:cell division protein FtsI (penicillin-binding protein 3)